ncbi:hypothetical protein CASFOL_014040 [Castilleja foliolosa]|uniref:C2 domain-containing protein n=1 Tax=Castilleja foliolosa TaxID=1961234 RepID=A0ABD3DQT6_9LAMI
MFRRKWINYVGRLWAVFKTNLTTTFIYVKKKDEPPYVKDYEFLDKETWEAFVAARLSQEEKMGQFKGDTANSAYFIKVELLAAKNIIGANLNGTSDPYAIITCGSEKRFSSMVPGSRNPMWGEEFNFSVDELPVEAYHVVKGMRSNTISKPKWVYPKVLPTRCQDAGDAEFGLFVMRHMLEIIKLDITNSFEKVLTMEEPYSSEDMDDVRRRWAECFLEVM